MGRVKEDIGLSTDFLIEVRDHNKRGKTERLTEGLRYKRELCNLKGKIYMLGRLDYVVTSTLL